MNYDGNYYLNFNLNNLQKSIFSKVLLEFFDLVTFLKVQDTLNILQIEFNVESFKYYFIRREINAMYMSICKQIKTLLYLDTAKTTIFTKKNIA